MEKVYVFVHPVYAFLAERFKGGVNKKGRQAFKDALGRKIEAISKEAGTKVLWVHPHKVLYESFMDWRRGQGLGFRKPTMEEFEFFKGIYAGPYNDLKAFAGKKLGERLLEVTEAIIPSPGIRGGLKKAMAEKNFQIPRESEFEVFGERKGNKIKPTMCVESAVEDLKDIFGKDIKVKVNEKLSVKGGTPSMHSFIDSYKLYLQEKMKARRRQARKLRTKKEPRKRRK